MQEKKKRILSFVTVIVMICTNVLTVFAEDMSDIGSTYGTVCEDNTKVTLSFKKTAATGEETRNEIELFYEWEESSATASTVSLENEPLNWNGSGDFNTYYRSLEEADITCEIEYYQNRVIYSHQIETKDGTYYYREVQMQTYDKLAVGTSLEEGAYGEVTQNVESITNDVIITNDAAGIPDPNFYQLVLNMGDSASGNGDGVVTVGEAKFITSFTSEYYLNESCVDCSDVLRNIGDFTGLSRYLTNIDYIYCMNYLTDSAKTSIRNEMKNLKYLQTVSESAEEGEDCSYLSQYANIKALYIDLYGKPDLSAVTSLKNLRTLAIYGECDNVENIVNALPLLEDLRCQDLDLSKVTNTSLERIGFRCAGNADFSKFTNLESIDIWDYSDGEKISGLKNLKLHYLSVYSGEVPADASFVKELPAGLAYLRLYGVKFNSVKNDTNITEIENLWGLSMEDAGLTDISGIEKHTQLYDFSVAGNKLTDVSVILNLPGLTYINVSRNSLETLPDFKQFGQLEGLEISGNKLTKEEILKKVPETYTNDKAWLVEATMNSTEDGKTYYTGLTSEELGMLMEFKNTNETYYFWVSEDGKIILNEECLSLMKQYKTSMVIHFCDEKGETGFDITVYGEDIPGDVKELTVTSPKITQAPEINAMYEDLYGEIEIISYVNTMDMPNGVSVSWFEEMDEEYRSLYYYDINNKTINKVNKYPITDRIESSGYEWNVETQQSYRVYYKEYVKSQDEAIYYIINNKYTIPVEDEGMYTDPDYIDIKDYDDVEEVEEKIKNAKEGDKITICTQWPSFEVSTDIWNMAIEKKLEFEAKFTYAGRFSSDVVWKAENMNKADEDIIFPYFSVDIGEDNSYKTEEATKELIGDSNIAIIYTGGSVSKFSVKLYVGEYFANGDDLLLVKTVREVKFDEEWNLISDKITKVDNIMYATVEKGLVELDISMEKQERDEYTDVYTEFLLIGGKSQVKEEPSGDTGVKDDPFAITEEVIVKSEEVAQKLVDTITSGTIRKNIDVYTDKALTITKDVFETMKDNSKNISVGVVDDSNNLMYEWKFDYATVDKDKFADVNLSVKFDTEKKAEIEKKTGQKDVFYLDFAHHGDLPGPATMKTYVGTNYKNGDIVYLYYYNEDTGKIETVGNKLGLVVTDGYVEYTITHCSVYLLSTDASLAETEADDKNDTKAEENKKDEVSVNTGDTFRPGIVVIMISTACMLMISLALSKRQNEE